MLEKFFKLKENKTTVRTEVVAGITTFMTMAYILAVNPNILSASGMDAQAVLIATALASFIGTIAMALLANYPFALAPGLGLNAYFAYTVCGSMGYSWQIALFAVFVEGIIFIVLSLTNVREAIFNAIPLQLKKGVSVGIGLFVAFIGYLLTIDGLTYQEVTQTFVIENHKYLHNFLELPLVSGMFLLGVVGVLCGIGQACFFAKSKNSIWPVSIGTILAVWALLLIAGLNDTAYYPSLTSPQSSLCLANSSSSEFTLRTMAIVSLIIPFVLAYIAYVWRALEKKE